MTVGGVGAGRPRVFSLPRSEGCFTWNAVRIAAMSIWGGPVRQDRPPGQLDPSHRVGSPVSRETRSRCVHVVDSRFRFPSANLLADACLAFDRPELFRGRQAAVPPGPVEEGCVEWLLSPPTNSGAGVSLRRTVCRAGSVTPVKELQLVAPGHALERTSGPASGYVSTFMEHGCHDRRTCFT